MTNTIYFFGKLSDQMGSHIQFNLTESHVSIAQLRNLLALQYDCEDLNCIANRATINDVFAKETDIVEANDSISFLSPFSGG